MRLVAIAAATIVGVLCISIIYVACGDVSARVSCNSDADCSQQTILGIDGGGASASCCAGYCVAPSNGCDTGHRYLTVSGWFSNCVPIGSCSAVSLDMAGTSHDLAGQAPADLAGQPPHDLAGQPPADLAGQPPADLAGQPPADLTVVYDLTPVPRDLIGCNPPNITGTSTLGHGMTATIMGSDLTDGNLVETTVTLGATPLSIRPMGSSDTQLHVDIPSTLTPGTYDLTVTTPCASATLVALTVN
jgi:hypothetical protein